MKNKMLFKSLMVVVIAFFLIASASPLLAAGKGKYGGKLIMAAKETFTQFGIPWKIRGPGDRAVQMAAQSLFQKTDVVGIYEPRLATSWEVAADKSNIIFKLRKGVKFNDGTDFNAQAVKFCFDEVKKTDRPSYVDIKSMEVIDDYTVKVNLSAFNFTVLDDFSLPLASIISPTAHETKDEKWLATNPVGTGPFILKDYKGRVHMKWEKNPDYWEKGYPYLDEIYQVVMPDPMTQEALFMQRGLHIMDEVDPTTATQMVAKGFHLAPLSVGGQMMLYFNTEDPNSVWSNPKVREALEYAIDKEKISDKLGLGYLTASYECIWGIGASTDTGTTPRKYNIAKAKALLKEAGYPNGLKAELITMVKFYNDMFVAIQGMAKEAGFDLKMTKLQPATWEEYRFGIAPVNKGLQDRQRGGGVSLLLNTKEDLSAKGIFYKGMVRPEGFESGLERALQAKSIEEVLIELGQMEKIAYDNSMFVPLWVTWDLAVLRPELKWVESERKDPFGAGGTKVIRMEYLYLDK